MLTSSKRPKCGLANAGHILFRMRSQAGFYATGPVKLILKSLRGIQYTERLPFYL